MQLREIIDLYNRDEIENWFKDYELSHYLTSTQIEQIETANIWSKERLASKIVDNFYMREIGQETPALFKLYVKNTMAQIMEKYLPLIYSASIEYDPLVNVDYTEEFTRNIEGNSENIGNSNSNSQNSSSGLNISNDTPQTNILRQELDQGIYANNVSQSDTNSAINDRTYTNSNSNSKSDEEYTKKVKGNSGVSATAQRMVQQFRDNIITIDRDIIDELNVLFMGIF